ncbi:MAG: hypothetical protein HQK76_10640 [Desulfobacterales bacterium]|nr:hypothetical protein [Desulfobacterales bacterium]
MFNILNILSKKIFVVQLVHWIFFALIMIQVFEFVMCVGIIIKRKVITDLYRFLNEYWKLDHLWKNILNLSLWFSACAAYISLWLLTMDIKDLSLFNGYNKYPYHSLYIYFCLIGFFLYTIKKSVEQIIYTVEICSHLKKMRIYKSVKKTLKDIRDSKFSKTFWGMWIKPVTSTSEWITDHFINHIVDYQMRKALLNFFLLTALEYIIRISVVVVAIFIVMD